MVTDNPSKDNPEPVQEEGELHNEYDFNENPHNNYLNTNYPDFYQQIDEPNLNKSTKILFIIPTILTNSLVNFNK